MREKILFLDSRATVAEMITYAKSQGIYTIVTDFYPPEKSFAKSLADEYWMISLANLDELEKKCREEDVTAVTCGIGEYAQDQTIELCERLGLPCYCTRESWHYNRNKADFKKACKKVGLPVATDYCLSDALTDEELDKVQFPVVVKPVDKYCNNGVSFCNNKEELIEAYHYARTVSENPRIIVERMITGVEILGQYALAEGEASLLGVTASYAPPGDASCCYSINTTATACTQEYIANTDPFAKKLLKEIGCREGFAWIQYKQDMTDGKLYAIEMGYRLSGCMVFIGMEAYTCFNAIHWMVDYALGRNHTPESLPKSMTAPWIPCACTYVIWTKKSGTVKEISGMKCVRNLPVKLIYEYIKPSDDIGIYQQAFAIMFFSEDCDEMCDMIEKINDSLSVKDTDGEEMLLYYTDLDRIKTDYQKGLQEVRL